jgi:hypothetical protein
VRKKVQTRGVGLKLTDLVILVFASWRLSNLLVEEEGPGNIFVKVRKYMGVYYDEYSQKQTTGWLGDLFSCVWCMSIWGSFILVSLNKWRVFRQHLILPLGLSGLVVLVHSAIRKLT